MGTTRRFPTLSPGTWWIDAAGVIAESPLGEVDELPGRYVLRGVADCHAHPAVVSSDGGPVALGVADIFGLLNDPGRSEDRRAQDREALARFRELLPAAVRLGVPVLAGTDVVGTIAGEVRLLGEFGLSPQGAFAAASTWPRQFLGLDAPSGVGAVRRQVPQA